MSQHSEQIELLIQDLCASRDLKAIQEFEARFPEHKALLREHLAAGELMARSRPDVPHPVPRFFPPKQPVWPVWATRGAIAAAVLGIGYASFLAGVKSVPPPPKVETAEAYPVERKPRIPVESSPLQLEYTPEEPGQPHEDDVKAPQYQVPRLERRVTIEVANGSLFDVFRQIEGQTGLKISIAPGLEDKAVTVQHTGIAAKELLQDLGQQFMFTPIPQGDDEVLVIPARDGSNGTIYNPDIDLREPGDR